ncbi:MAG: AAA family ATPase [Candidatus Omnitrophica bacterium]|nr:AAA family ATPase [Candidatus Omnitrophota bacterium]MBU4492282.1 AAA family ATPase [Euryarchaeota archaeon]
MTDEKKDLKQEILNKIDFHTFYKQHLKSPPEDMNAEQIKACCPFHDDKTPSLSVNLETGLWHCFGCNAEGNVFKFYTDLYKVNFPQALHEISKDLGIPTESKNRSLPLDVNAPQKCHDTLMSSPELLERFKKKRGYTDETIKKCKFGFSKVYPIGFTIPINDKDGKLVNFKTRLLTDSPKYLIAGGKAEVLYNLAEMLSKSDSPVMFIEGEFDVELLRQYGFLAVSSITGAQTFRKEWLIYFKGRTVIIILDADKTGRTAAQKVARMLLPVAKEVKIINLSLTRGKDVTDYFVSNAGTKEELEKIIKETEPVQTDVLLKENLLPLSLQEFLKQDFPALKYLISHVLPEGGRGMISGWAGTCKSILLQNFALAMACGKKDVLGKFEILPAKVLYLDLEMGNSRLKARFEKMCAKEPLAEENLFVIHLPGGIDLNDSPDMLMVQGWIEKFEIDVVIIDPLGSAWHGNENLQEEVQPFTLCLNRELIEKHGVGLLMSHHWKKSTKDFQTGGQMAAGSYKWPAWLDCHITIEGPNETDLTIKSSKQRDLESFKTFLVKLDRDTLWLEFIKDFEKKFFASTLEDLFDSFKSERVSTSQLFERAKEQKICEKTTIRKLIAASKVFDVDKRKTPFVLSRKGTNKDLYEDTHT